MNQTFLFELPYWVRRYFQYQRLENVTLCEYRSHKHQHDFFCDLFFCFDRIRNDYNDLSDLSEERDLNSEHQFLSCDYYRSRQEHVDIIKRRHVWSTSSTLSIPCMWKYQSSIRRFLFNSFSFHLTFFQCCVQISCKSSLINWQQNDKIQELYQKRKEWVAWSRLSLNWEFFVLHIDHQQSHFIDRHEIWEKRLFRGQLNAQRVHDCQLLRRLVV